jgi:hypothetical protein
MKSYFDKWRAEGGGEDSSSEEDDSDEDDSNGNNFGENNSDERMSNNGSTESESYSLNENLRQYLREYLNRQLVQSPQGSSLLGKIIGADPKKGSKESWILTSDASLSPHRVQYADDHKLSLDEVQEKYYVSSAELVSKVLAFDATNNWRAYFDQVNSDLRQNETLQAWFNGQEGLHVHFGIGGGEIDLATCQNIIALYGLFESEIEQWLPLRRRDNIDQAKRVRIGMEHLKYNTEAAAEEKGMLFKRQKYTPQGFTEKVYLTRTLNDLKTIASGAIPANLAAGSSMAMDTVTANISMARDNKPTTIEFRQHEATIDPDDIYWWALFLGKLVRYAYLLKQVDFKFLDKEPLPVPSLVELVTNKSILDLLTFPQEGIQYFAAKKIRFNDLKFNMKRELDNKVVKERIKRRALGQDCNGKSKLLLPI